MAKKILKPNMKIKKININEIEIKTETNRIIKSFIFVYIVFFIVLVGELFNIYISKRFYIESILVFIPLFYVIYYFIFLSWSLKINKSKLIVNFKFKKYIIDLNNLVTIEAKHSYGRGSNTYYLRIVFKEEEILKEIKLVYETHSRVFHSKIVDVDKVIQLINSIEYMYNEPVVDEYHRNRIIDKNKILSTSTTIFIVLIIVKIAICIMMKKL